MPGLAPDATINLIENIDDVLDFREWLGCRRNWLGVDIETTGLNLGRDRIRLCQFGDTQKGWALSWEDWRGVVKDIMPRYKAPMVFHNAAFDLGFLKRDGVDVPQRFVHDTMIMCHLIEPRYAIGLKPSAAKYVDKSAWAGKDALTEAFKGGGWNWGTIPIDHPSYYVYSVMDTMLTSALADVLWPKIESSRYIYEIEMACIHVLRDARLRGVNVDLDYTQRTKAMLLAEMAQCQTKLPFEPSKDRQIYQFFERSGRERGYSNMLETWWPWRTDTDNCSFDDDALKWAEEAFPNIVPPLRTWRKNAKLVNSYLDNILDMNVDGILRCNIKQVGARTGRMSITEPALQTLPRGRSVRDAFIPREGHKIVLADYAQMEARVFASYANCQPMIDSFVRGDDQHTWVASLCYEKPMEEVDPLTERQIAKNVGYANIYGAGNAKIAITAGAPLPVIEAFKEKYDALFPEVELFKQSLIGTVMKRIYDEGEGYVVTRLGRRIPVDKDKPYKGLNYLVQGSATGDILKLKLVELAEAGLDEYIRLPIHDEIYSEVPDDCVDEALHILETTMPETRLFTCPLAIETDVVERWGEHYEKDPTKRYHYERTAA